jgi:glycosyltransferase involved in cell wall biosynthesis
VGIRDAVVIENGVDARRFAPLDAGARTSARRRFGMSGPTLVVPGRIAAQKNQLVVVRAVARLRSDGAWPDGAKVLLAGRVEAHTRYVARVDRAIRQLRLEQVVMRMDPVRDAESLLGAADATLLPSRFEGMPNVVLESLACATPVILSPAANVDELIHDGVTGFEALPTVTGVTDAMRRFFATRADARCKLGEAGRRRTLARFSVERMVAGTCAVYDRVSA